jgi:hypothetical protein
MASGAETSSSDGDENDDFLDGNLVIMPHTITMLNSENSLNRIVSMSSSSSSSGGPPPIIPRRRVVAESPNAHESFLSGPAITTPPSRTSSLVATVSSASNDGGNVNLGIAGAVTVEDGALDADGFLPTLEIEFGVEEVSEFLTMYNLSKLTKSDQNKLHACLYDLVSCLVMDSISTEEARSV